MVTEPSKALAQVPGVGVDKASRADGAVDQRCQGVPSAAGAGLSMAVHGLGWRVAGEERRLVWPGAGRSLTPAQKARALAHMEAAPAGRLRTWLHHVGRSLSDQENEVQALVSC